MMNILLLILLYSNASIVLCFNDTTTTQQSKKMLSPSQSVILQPNIHDSDQCFKTQNQVICPNLNFKDTGSKQDNFSWVN